MWWTGEHSRTWESWSDPTHPHVLCSLGEMLALGLRAFLELMEHGVVSWETLSIPFVRKVCVLFQGQWSSARIQPS